MKKAVIVAMAVLIALALVGIGYALWSETLWVDGSVQTGTLDVGITPDGTYDTEPPEKDVSYMTIDSMTSHEGVYCQIFNAYPSIDYYAYFQLANLGTVPFHTLWTPLGSNLPAGATLEIQLIDYNDVDGDLVYYEDISGWQFHGGDTAWCRVHVHLDNDAEEGAYYSFTNNLDVYQWNEGPYGGQVLPRPYQF